MTWDQFCRRYARGAAPSIQIDIPVRRRRIRLYSERDIQRVRMIRYLTEERGLNLAGVQMILEIQEHYHEELTWVFGESEEDGESAGHRESADDRNKKGKGR